MPLRRKITLPKRFSGSKPGLLKPADWNAMQDCLAALRAEVSDLAPQSSADIGIRHSAGGWVAYQKRRTASRSSSSKGGLILLAAGVDGSGNALVRVKPGYVNSLMPTLGGIAINAATPPTITVLADVWVWIKTVGTFAAPDSYVVTIETSSTSAVPAGTEITATGFTSFRGIGRVDFTAGTPPTTQIINSHSGGDLGVDSFGSVIHWWLQ